ncbi:MULTISPECIES: oligoribonuclease [unclassified Methylophaga]|uniref:oligoribonuclease n=2 Tax=Methylophaga TaxID=40222 RepID=UPI0032E45889|tara:strand:+ start:148563 stop:149123 length:561 start_codon:yes stop_codon:yes gene_type:complete
MEPMAKSKHNLIWIDLEMTGLDTNNDYIIEIATIVTDGELNILAEGPILAIHQPDSILAGMDEWNTRQHGGSGLTERVRNSVVTVEQAEQETLEFLKKYVPAGTSPMCGNSICQDRRFMARLMPDLEAYFHYRNLDVSSFKEIARRWAPKVEKAFKKKSSHLAMDDIKDSIRELQHYREHMIKVPE